MGGMQPTERLIELGRREASRLGHGEVYPEHLMLALVRVRSGEAEAELRREPALRALRRAGLDPGQVGRRLERLLRRKDLFPPEGPAESQMEEVFRLQRREAAALRHPDFGGAHLLLSLVQARVLVADCLGAFGATYQSLREIVRDDMAKEYAQQTAPPPVHEAVERDRWRAPGATTSAPGREGAPAGPAGEPAPAAGTGARPAVYPGRFGTCCESLGEALSPPPDPMTGETEGAPESMFSVEEDGILYLNIGYFAAGDHPAFLAQSVIFCPFCGARLQDERVVGGSG